MRVGQKDPSRRQWYLLTDALDSSQGSVGGVSQLTHQLHSCLGEEAPEDEDVVGPLRQGAT